MASAPVSFSTARRSASSSVKVQLRLRKQDAVLRHLRFERLEAVLHRGEIMALPNAAHPRRRDRQATDTRT